MTQPSLVLYYHHVLTEDEMELVTSTLSQIFVDPLLHFSTIREDGGSYETSVLVHLPEEEDEEEYPDDGLGRPYVHRLVIQPKYKQDFINQQVLFRTQT